MTFTCNTLYNIIYIRYNVSSEEFYIEGKKELVRQIDSLKEVEAQLQRKCNKIEMKRNSAILKSNAILQQFQKLPKMGKDSSVLESLIDDEFDFFVQNSPAQR